jgi:beta-phosphoglucomutase-like phosphatase (HAD superfamily)
MTASSSASRPSHLLLDHDGVPVDTEPLYFQATKSALAELGVEIDMEVYRPCMTSGQNDPGN